MPSGGSRPGSGRPRGRPPGSRAKIIRDTLQQATEFLKATGLIPFEGNAHAFLVWVYKHPNLPPDMRMEAAKAAAPYETPRLAMAQITIRRPHEMTDEELAAAILDANEQAGVAEGLRRSASGGASPTRH